MGDVGEVAKTVRRVLDEADKLTKRYDDAAERKRVRNFQQEWSAAVAAGDVDTLNRLLAERNLQRV